MHQTAHDPARGQTLETARVFAPNPPGRPRKALEGEATIGNASVRRFAPLAEPVHGGWAHGIVSPKHGRARASTQLTAVSSVCPSFDVQAAQTLDSTSPPTPHDPWARTMAWLPAKIAQ
ncbi:hypothetical protein CDD83_10588 [Cordyceps sp. RAO-2017]|nr:hypothetical protein CDD83_10588 [Cordyceps sp. RAO-2017]